MEAIAREMAKAHAHYQALLNERSTAAMPTNLKMTSGALGFKVMDPFDWTKDKAIFQRWQMWLCSQDVFSINSKFFRLETKTVVVILCCNLQTISEDGYSKSPVGQIIEINLTLIIVTTVATMVLEKNDSRDENLEKRTISQG